MHKNILFCVFKKEKFSWKNRSPTRDLYCILFIIIIVVV